MSCPFILASASPRRADILRKAGLDFEIIPSHAAENGSFLVEGTALANAFIKAQDISGKYPDALVLGADTVIEFQNKIFGKPHSLQEAFDMLRLFSGKTHIVTTGCALLRQSDQTEVRFADCSEVTFRKLTDEDIKHYLSLTHVLDKAGAYAIQENGEILIEKIEGDMNNIIGLPSRAISSVYHLVPGL